MNLEFIVVESELCLIDMLKGRCECFFFFFQAEDGIRDLTVTGVQTCALPISAKGPGAASRAHARVRSHGPTRIDVSARRGAANVRCAADRTQARRRRPHARGMVRPRRRLHGRARARLPDGGAAHGGLFPRARAAGARGPHRRDARIGAAPRVRRGGHPAYRQAPHGRRRSQGGAPARRARRRLRRRGGGGAFLPALKDGLELARTMIALGEDRGCPTVVLLTAMDRPLGRACGNSLETEEAILALRGEGPEDLMEVTYALGVEMLLAAGVEKSTKQARKKLQSVLGSGLAAEKFERMIEAQGGNPKVLEDPSVLPQAQAVEIFAARETGVVTRVEPRTIGRAIVAMGGGRRQVDDVIDPSVGFVITVKPGDKVLAGEPIASVFAKDAAGVKLGFEGLERAIEMGDRLADKPLPLVSHRVTKDGVEELTARQKAGEGP